MKITDIITEAANPAQQAAIAISMKKAGKKPKQSMAEGEGMLSRSKYDKRYLDKFDPTEVMNISDDPEMKAHRTTRQGSLRTSKKDLEFAFGPSGEDDTWVLEFRNGLIATVYPNPNSNFGMDWFIGGNHPDIEDYVLKAYSAAINDLEEGVAEGSQQVDSLVTDALKIMRGSDVSDAVQALKTVLGDREYNSRRGHYNFYVRQLMDMSGQQGMAEGYNPEYDDEAGMADNNLETLDRAVEGIDRLIDSGDNLPEWCQEKIAVAKSMLVAVWDYMYSEEASDEVDPEVEEMFEAMDQLAEEMAVKNGVSADLVWEQFEALPDNVLYETAAWRRKEGKSKKGGLNAKGVASYRRENPGSKLQTAVTTKPSKLKPGSKAAKRRKSFCARMGGVKGPMKKPNGKPTRKALALRKWNC